MYSSSQLIPPEDLFNSEFDPHLPYATRVYSREAYPGVTKPLDLTAIAMPNDHGMRRQLRDLGVTTIDPPGVMSNRVHQGRIYANLSWVMWMTDILPAIEARDFAQLLSGQHIEPHITRPEITKAERSTANRHKLRFYCGMINAALSAKKRLEKNLALRNSIDLGAKTNSQLDGLIVAWQDELIVACEWNSRGTLAGLMIIGALKRALGASKAQYLVAILSDLGDVESAAPAEKIREIAQVAKRRNPTLARALKRSYQRWETLHEIDANAHDALRAVVDRYGYRSVAEFLVSAPSWAEDPTPVMDAFAGLLPANSREKSGQQFNSEAARHTIMAEAGPLKRACISTLIKFARSGIRARERTKAGLIIRVDMLRQLFREIGRRLLNDDRIDEVSDLYFLTLEEVRAALTGDSGTDLHKQAALRRLEVERLEALGEPDELICGHNPVLFAAQRLSPGESERIVVLHGLGVSGSTLEGIARVVTSSDELDTVKPGEILVASHTDAGWTPYFTLAAALIVETGGLLGHSSVVARELGLPAVVNVQVATKIIKTGDRLHLDPATGTVRILTRAKSENAVVH